MDSDHLIPMPCEEGKDEISSMIRNYNRMVERTNGLIETVYKNKIHEQEMLVGRKKCGASRITQPDQSPLFI